MDTPADLKYSKEHEWARAEGDTSVIGITDFAQNQLGDVVYVELPKVGTQVKLMVPFGVVESVKTASDGISSSYFFPLTSIFPRTGNETP